MSKPKILNYIFFTILLKLLKMSVYPGLIVSLTVSLQSLFSVVLCPWKFKCLRSLNQFVAQPSYRKLSHVLKELWDYLCAEVPLAVLCFCLVRVFTDFIKRLELITSDPKVGIMLDWQLSTAPWWCSSAGCTTRRPVIITGGAACGPDASWVSGYSTDCREMHHTLIITANVRGSLATGRHGLSRRTHNMSTQKNTPTPRPQGDPAEHASAYLCSLVLKGERVCVCADVSACTLLSSFF